MSERSTDIAYRWSPIKSLDAIDCYYDFSEIDSLQRQWLSIKERREASNPDSYKAFLERLDRSWSIETGIIEGLYTLDRGVTETLVQRGFNAELIDRSATNQDPVELVRVLEDHREAAQGIYRYIRNGSPLSITLIRQLHVTLTQHQLTFTAVNQFGQRFPKRLDRGGFKTERNNPTSPDGRIHEYCPPLQVDSEIDNLVELHAAHNKQGYHPLLIAAWLHHAFTQIHPFQDGNGRVARSLLTWHLVRENYLSVVVSRDDRPAYIDTLEAADGGNLDAFVDYLVQLEKRTILEALAEREPVSPPKAKNRNVREVIDNIVRQIRRQNRGGFILHRSATELGRVLSDKAEEHLKAQSEYLRQRLLDVGLPVSCEVRNDDGDWRIGYEKEIPWAAMKAGQWTSFNRESFLIEFSLAPLSLGLDSYPGLTFLISLHHTGMLISEVMAAMAFAKIEGPLSLAGLEYHNCADSPFTFVWDDDADVITPRFINWIEEALSEALRYWQEFLA